MGEGMNSQTDNNPYMGFLFTSFQERVSKIVFNNTAKLASEAGDEILAKICNRVAADEARHEIAYQKVVDKFFEVDPEGVIHSYKDIMQKGILMPGHFMYDGENNNLFNEFSDIAEHVGVFTPLDYADIVEHCNCWRLKDRTFKGDAKKSQEYVLGLPARIRKLEQRTQSAHQEKRPVKVANISWIFKRPIHH